MKKILLAVLIIASANAENYKEVCVNGVNIFSDFGKQKMVDICIMFPKSKIDAATKETIIHELSIKSYEEVATVKGKEGLIEEIQQDRKIHKIYLSKFSIYSECTK